MPDNLKHLNVAAKLGTLDEKIAWHYEQISGLKAQRNLHALISRIPNELLSKVFFEYAASQSQGLMNLGWMELMRVCRRRNEILRAHQRLWGFIEVGEDNPNQLACQLARRCISHPAPRTHTYRWSSKTQGVSSIYNSLVK